MSEHKTILLVENSRTALAGITLQLEEAGYIVDGVRFGLDAIEKAKTNEYFAIVMDLFMPQMNGYEAAKQLRNFGYKKPILALTASQDPRDKKISLESGMNVFVQKSDDLKSLFDELNKLT